MKTQIKKYRLLILLLTLFLLSEIGAAQDEFPIKYIVVKEVDAASTQIAVEIPDKSLITKIRLNSETDGNSVVKDVSTVKSLMMPVELVDGENIFNIVGYADNKIVYSTPNPIVIVRKKLSTTGTAADSQDRQRFSQTSNDTKGTKDKRLRLVGKGKIKNQETYNFEIDASELPPQVGNYAVEIFN